MTIDGRDAVTDARLEVINPATGEAFASAPDCTREQLDTAVASSKAAFKLWRNTPLEERQAKVRQAGELLIAKAAALARPFLPAVEGGR